MWLEKLIDLIVSWWNTIVPFFVLDEYERGVVLRLGRFNREVGPGLHPKWPFVEDIMSENVVTETKHHYDQHLTTKDKVHVSIRMLTKFRICNVRTFLLEVEDADSVLSDAVMRIAAKAVAESTYEEFVGEKWEPMVSRRVKLEAKKYGVEVEECSVNQRYKFDWMLLTRKN